MPRRLLVPALGALIALGYLAGGLDFLERYLHDARSRLVSRTATGDLVVVAIDPESLSWLEVWPWPRRYYARAIEHLLAAGARSIVLDLDFSSVSDPQDDARLAEALAAAGPDRIALPVFRQFDHQPGGSITTIDTVPVRRFGEQAALVHADFRPDADGIIRRVRAVYVRQGREVPALAVWFDPGRPTPEEIVIDFSIDPFSIPQLSFADVLEGTFDPKVIAGKHVIVGATANELRDIASVPRYRLLPGALIHGLVFETLRQGRALREIGGWPIALATILLTVAFDALASRFALAAGFLALIVLSFAIVALAAVFHPLASISLQITPLLFGLTCSFGAIMIRTAQRKDVILREVVNNSFDAILTFGQDRKVVSCNRAAELLLRCPAHMVQGTPLERFLLSDNSPDVLDSPTSAEGSFERLARREDGAIFPVEVAFSAMRLDGEWIGVAAIRDISERKAQEASLRRLAMHDPLTGLPNRVLLQDHAAQAIAVAEHAGRSLALLLLDLDRFKEVNDTLGHQVGDELLQQVGPRLQLHLRDTDTLARLGGDEFAILLPDIRDANAACALAERIVEALSQPFPIHGLELEIGASIGVACFPIHGRALGELLQRADVAMYAAKSTGLGFAYYNAEEDTNSVRRLTLQGDLRRAIEENQLVLHYQPKIATKTGQLVGFEAMVRWAHPSRGIIPPNHFVPFAERTGLIKPLTDWVLEAALKQWKAWSKQGLQVSIAVNLSVPSLQETTLSDQIRAVLRRYGCPASRLHLEITETAFMTRPAAATSVLSSLADLGCRLSLDDFGTGYSSLSYLQKLPIDEVKIDRSFVMAMDRDDSAAVIVRSIINLAHSLHLSVVAEGVESQSSYDALRALGCEQVQGFLLGRPMAPAAIDAWLGHGADFIADAPVEVAP